MEWKRNGKILAIGITTAACVAAVVAYRYASSHHDLFQTPKIIVHEASGSVAVPRSSSRSNFVLPIETRDFLDPVRFDTSRFAASSTLSGWPVAAVINHHVLASDVMTRLSKTLRKRYPHLQRLIILAPDHYKRGQGTISIAETSYRTAEGVVAIDEAFVERLRTRGFATLADRPLWEGEHGIGAVLPFLTREYGASFQIVPIVIRADVNRDRVAALGRELAEGWNEETLVVVSADMSHYLPEEIAMVNDVKTRAWLETRDAGAMAVASDDFTDNGPAFVALFAFFNALNITPQFQLIDHRISTEYGGPSDYTTSYLTGVWTVKP